jgi:hypothetical protein
MMAAETAVIGFPLQRHNIVQPECIAGAVEYS